MSVHRSYFRRNNTIISESCANTGRNPVVELYYGKHIKGGFPSGFSRFIFDLDLDLLREKVDEGVISSGCSSAMTHTLRMTNTSHFDLEMLNTKDSFGRNRATSFDLILFRIPEISECTTDEVTFSGDPCDPIVYSPTASTVCIPDQGGAIWDEGVGYDHINFKGSMNWPSGGMFPQHPSNDRSFSSEPSNWLWRTKTQRWSEPGIYDIYNNGVVNYSGVTSGITGSTVITVIDRQHFELGNEDIEFDMSDEINSILDGTLTGCTGWGIAFAPELEKMTGDSKSYSVGFFSKYTNSFYEPFLETMYDDLVMDDRNNFIGGVENKLYLYTYKDGDFIDLDNDPVVEITAPGNDAFSGYSGTTCRRGKGVYELTVPPLSGLTGPCMVNDVWRQLRVSGADIPDNHNEFMVRTLDHRVSVGSSSMDPEELGFDLYGIMEDEGLLPDESRKVVLRIRKAYEKKLYTTPLAVQYRLYVREGNTEVQVQEWTPFNRTSDGHYFILDARDKIANDYYLDIKVSMSGEKRLYKRKLKFKILSTK